MQWVCRKVELCAIPVNPDGSHANCDGDDGREDTEQQKQEYTLGGFHLEKQDEFIVKCHCIVVLLYRHYVNFFSDNHLLSLFFFFHLLNNTSTLWKFLANYAQDFGILFNQDAFCFLKARPLPLA